MTVTITKIELLALKKLSLISQALAVSLKDQGAAQEQRTLTRVLVDVITRAELSS